MNPNDCSTAPADVILQRVGSGARDVVDAVKGLAAESPSWEIMERQTEEYSRGIGAEALIMACSSGFSAGTALALAETTGRGGAMYVANIIPQEGEMSVDDYNAIAKRFVSDLRHFSGRKKLGIRCRFRVPTPPTTLEGIIPGGRTRSLFRSFMAVGEIWRQPCITHPADIERLDAFICAVHRFQSRVYLGALQWWLSQEKGWPEHDADWVVKRIATGLDVLRAHRRF